MKVALLIILCFCEANLNIDVFYSHHSNLNLVQYVTDKLIQEYKTVSIYLSDIDDCKEIHECMHFPSLLIDITSSLTNHEQIRRSSMINDFLHINLSKPRDDYGNYEFFTHISPYFHSQSLKSLTTHLGLKPLIIIGKFLSEIVAHTKSDWFDVNEYVHISENENQKLLDQIIGKNIKPTGIQNMLILVEDSTFIEKILTSFKNTMMFIKGYGFVLSSNGIYGKLENGLLICVEKGLENASSYEEYEFLAIKNILDIIFAYEGEMEILINYLEKKTHNHHLKPEFSIINIQNTEKIIIGSIYSDLSIYEKPMSVMTTENQNLDYSNNIEMYSTSIFPGDSLDIPNSKINITISIANGIKDPGYPDTYLVKLIKLGCLYAIRIAQNSGILSNFNINVQDTNCGATVYNQTYSLPCYSENKPKLGAVFLSSPIDSMCVGTLQDFRILNIPIPIISDRCSTPILSDKTLVPEFMRIIAPGSFASGVIASLTTIFGWKNVAVFSSTFWLKESYDFFIKEASRLNIKILNQQIPFEKPYEQNLYEENKEIFDGFVKSRCRILVLFLDPLTLMNVGITLYDLGYRKGDVVAIINYRISTWVNFAGDPVKIKKIAELIPGSLTVSQGEWIGEYGQDLKTNYESVYGDSLFRGFSYDQMMLALRGIDFTINSGLNIEDPYVLNKLLRIQKFRGATGTVSISPDSNDRSNFVLSIFSLVYNPDSPSHGDTEIGNYSLSSTQRFSFKKDITWPDGTKNVPKDMIEFNYRCEYEQDADHFETGSWVFRSINILFTVFAVSLVFISYKNLKLMRLEDLTEKKLIKFDDILMYILVILEMFQYLVLAPDIRFKNTNISQISNYLSGGLVDILTVYGDEYWISVYLLISLFLIFFYFVCCDLFIKLRHFSDDSLGLSLIFFSNFVTIPMIMVCLNVFKCTWSTSSKYTDSYNDQDCAVYCWQDFHLGISIASFLTLLFYIPLILFYRPQWNLLRKDKNIIIQPVMFNLKFLLQLMVIVFYNTLDPLIFGFLIPLIFISYLIITFKNPVFNYSRLNLWSSISHITVIFTYLLSATYLLIPQMNPNLYTIIKLPGICIIFVAGLIVQYSKYPSYLYSQKGIDIKSLMQFSIAGNISALTINRLNTINRGRVYEIQQVSEVNSSENFLET